MSEKTFEYRVKRKRKNRQGALYVVDMQENNPSKPKNLKSALIWFIRSKDIWVQKGDIIKIVIPVH